MVMGLAIQTIMGPVNLVENALVRAVLRKGAAALTPASALFDETTTLDDTVAADCEIVDEQGNPVVRRAGTANSKKAIQANNNNNSTKSLEEILLDTWDQGVSANLQPLLSAITEQNVNYQTSGDHWTALMIVSGLNCPGVADAIRELRTKYKADVTLTDKDGWTALHWAAFHNSEIAAKELRNEAALLTVKDNDGKTPFETAKAEGNNDIVALLQPESKKSQ